MEIEYTDVFEVLVLELPLDFQSNADWSYADCVDDYVVVRVSQLVVSCFLEF